MIASVRREEHVVWNGTKDCPMGPYLTVPPVTPVECPEPIRVPQCRERVRESICDLLAATPLTMRQLTDRLDLPLQLVGQQLHILQKRGLVQKAGWAPERGAMGRREYLYGVPRR